MSTVGQIEKSVQNRVVKLFRNQLGYAYLGNWQDRLNNRNIEEEIVRGWLTKRGIRETLISRALHQLSQAAALGEGKNLYDANKEVYSLLRYGVKVKPGAGQQTQTVWLVDWKHPLRNDFAIAEEVTITGEHKKRPDIVLYVNGIALGVLELKRSIVSVSEGIRQNLDNQKKSFIRSFFATIQLVMAGNDSEGLRYGAIETPEKYYLTWKEENPAYNAQADARANRYLAAAPCVMTIPDAAAASASAATPLDCALLRLANKTRFLELIHEFIVFDSGVKKVPRHNQYFGVRAAQKHIVQREGGIIWHTQGSGKSLTMVWLAKWIRENVADARVLIITDRTELDEQIEKVFLGVNEQIHRTKSGADLVHILNRTTPWLVCSLVHKFGRGASDDDDRAADEFITEIRRSLPHDFRAKGNLFVFVDECHRTQSGKLHDAMEAILPGAVFLGFTGTPLLKADKKKSIEIFGGYIHTYKYDEAVRDGVVLDLRYEARDIDQYVAAPHKVDQWFAAKTSGLSDMAKLQLKQRWGTMKQVLSSQSRLERIVSDILMDMETRPRLLDGRGNALLVCASIYQACKVYELFSKTELATRCAIITSYKPSPADIKQEDSGEGMTEKLRQYEIYRKMLADFFDQPADQAMYRVEEFEQKVKERFIKEPGQMRLLIVVDRLLTGFDAPSATYLYIDKQMRDHGLFQAICRVNRLDGDDKEYGYIVDYKDLFNSLEGAIADYTGGAFEGYDQEDVAELLTNRLQKARERLEETRETIKALCEPVALPQDTADYLHYFCAADTADKSALRVNEPKRAALYKATAALLRAYASVANEMSAAGYTTAEIAAIRHEVVYYDKVSQEVKLASGDLVDMKQYEPAMRHLLDTYIRAEDSEAFSKFADLGLVELLVDKGLGVLDELPATIRQSETAMAEAIENNIRRIVTDERPVNPKYYDEMSELLIALTKERRDKAIAYKAYLEKILALAKKVVQPEGVGGVRYPTSLNSRAKRNLFDTLGHNEELTLLVDRTVLTTKKDGWIGNRFKEREVERAVWEQVSSYEVDVEELVRVIKQQDEYK